MTQAPNPIRETMPADVGAIKSIAVATGLFAEHDVAANEDMLTGFFASEANDHHWLTYEDDGTPIAVAYYAPEPLTDGTWNLLMIAVHPSKHGQGVGTALINHVEQALIAGGARILLVDTSGTDDFERTRAFYDKCGYDLEARIRDYYAPGDDKITFWKALRPT